MQKKVLVWNVLKNNCSRQISGRVFLPIIYMKNQDQELEMLQIFEVEELEKRYEMGAWGDGGCGCPSDAHG